MIFGILALMALGLPIAFVFMLLSLVGVVILWGSDTGLRLFILNMRDSLSSFVLIPIAMFVLMGEVMFLSGIGMRMLDTLGKWLGRLPGRLAVLAVLFSTLFATLSGSSVSSVALMATVLKPEMEALGYKKPMTIGSIMGVGGLAQIIPPSGLAIVIAAIGKISIGRLLIAGIIPGLILATFYLSYIILRCLLQPSIAPSYEITSVPLFEKIKDTVKYVLPLGLIIASVLGAIFVGFATPSEAAALGAFSSLILTTCYGKLSLKLLKEATAGTLKITVMVFMIIAFALTFSQIMAFSGVTHNLSNWAVDLPVSPIMIIIYMMAVVLVMGTFMDVNAIIMITLPIFMPIIDALGFSPVWFGLLMLINIEMALTTPPFGMLLFVMKGVCSPDTTMGDIYRAGLPFLACTALVMALVILFPTQALWLPSMMLAY